MKTAHLRIELAILNGLRRLQAFPGRPRDLEQLTDLWPAYGLRHSDLRAGLAGLAARRLVAIQDFKTPDGPRTFVSFTQLGTRWLDSQSAFFEYSLLMPRQRASVARRRPGYRAPKCIRRREDAPPAQASA